MGCFDGAEVCKLVGTYIYKFHVPMGVSMEQKSANWLAPYILNQIKTIMNSNDVELYRDDGLGVLRNHPDPEIDRKRKELIRIFQDCELSITCQTNVKFANSLDIQLNLNSSSIRPYMKPNNNPVYINKLSNHPPNVLDKLPKSISRRISYISSNEAIFYKSIKDYENALKCSGFNENLTYLPPTIINEEHVQEKKKRKRNIIWYNPPYSVNIKTNIGKTFFKLVKKHFPKENRFHKIFNKNSLKLSYSCMKNVSEIISSHNKSILKPSNPQFGCNCRDKGNCPLDNKCLTPHVIYKAGVSNTQNDEVKSYIGLAETSFKDRYCNHTKAFTHKTYSKDTELSKYIWELKDNQITYRINWNILKRIHGKLNSRNCQLCLCEKYFIINSLDDKNLLNKRNEFITKCRHQNKIFIE